MDPRIVMSLSKSTARMMEAMSAEERQRNQQARKFIGQLLVSTTRDTSKGRLSVPAAP
jgi:hypothetical protein